METLELSIADAIAHVRLSRGDQLNTMVQAFWTEIIDVFATIDQHPEVRAVVISAAGRHFTAGLDLSMAASTLGAADEDPARAREKLRRQIKQMQESFSVIDRCRVPVIAVIQGGCIGGGVDLVTACDIRIGTQDCFFTIKEIDIGIVADVGTLQRLPSLLPQGLVRELAYTGRRFAASEALHWGFITGAQGDAQAALEEGMALARHIAAKSPLAIAGIKRTLDYGRSHSIEDGLDYVATWNAAMLQGEDLTKAVTATLQKQETSFKDLVA